MHSLSSSQGDLRTGTGQGADPSGPVPSSTRAALAEPLRDWVLPRLVERHRNDVATRELGARWLASLATGEDPDALCAAIEQLALQGLCPEDIQLEWLAAAAAELGRRWEEDDCSFSDVTVGLVRMQCAMRRLNHDAVGGRFDLAGACAPRILLLLAPGEQHAFGLTLVAEAFRREGWDVGLAHDSAGPTAQARAAQTAFDLIGISVGSTARAGGLRRLCADLRRASCRPDTGLLLGGPYFATQSGLLDPADWGADLIARDARAAVRAATRWRAAAQAVGPSSPTLAAVP